MALDDLKTINVEGLGDIQVPQSYGDVEIKQHVQQMQNIRRATSWSAPTPINLSSPQTTGPSTQVTMSGADVRRKLQEMHYQLQAQDNDEITQPGDLLIRAMQAGREKLQQTGAEIGSNIATKLVSPTTRASSMEAESMRTIDPTTNKTIPPTISPATKGIAAGVGSFTGGMAADPMTYLVGGLGNLGRGGRVAMSLGFGAYMGKGAVESAGELGSMLDRSDIPSEEKYKKGTETVLNAAAAGLAAGHGVSESTGYLSRPSERLAPRMDPLRGEMSVPRTAQPAGTPESTVQVSPETFLKKVGGIEGGAEEATAKEAKIQSLMEGYKKGDPIPNASIVYDKSGNVLDADGRHRAEAARRLGLERIPVDIHRRDVEAPASGDTEPTLTESGVHDLRDMDSNARHDWINKNAPFAIEGGTLEEAQARAKQIYGPKFQAQPIQFIDNSGVTRFAVRHVPTGEAGVVAPQPAGPMAPEARELNPAAQVSYAKIQQLEGDFHEMTGGKHGEVLNQLLAHVDANLPPGTPIEGRLARYALGLRELKLAINGSRGLPDLQQAFNKAAAKLQAGTFAPVTGVKGLTDSQIDSLNKLHVDTMLTKWESYNDTALVSKKVFKSLQDPVFDNAVRSTNDPVHQARYDALLDRAGAARANDPIGALGRTLSNQSLTPGDLARGSLRENLASAAHTNAINTKALEGYTRDWEKRPLQDSVRFIDSIESGDINAIPDPKDRAMASQLRDMLDQKRKDIQGLGIGALDEFYDNYFPHVWKFGITDVARQMLSGRRPLAGGQGFLKARTYNSFAEGIANGMEPVTYNPVKMALLKLHEMTRFEMAHTTMEELKSRGLIQQFARKDIPEGWARLNDSLFESKTFVKPGTTSVDPATLGQSKAWYAPADAARPINNHLSPGLRGNAIFDSVNAYNNILNQANLGLSAFHAVETGVNAIVSQQATGLGKILRGDITGVKDIATSVTAPVSKYLTGSKLLREYMEPGRYSAMAGMADALDMAGGRIAMPGEYKNAAMDNFRNAWKEAAAAPNGSFKQLGKAGQGIYRGLGVLLEKASVPLMEYYVPRVKLGVFADMAKDTLERLGPQASHEVVRAELSKVWDSVDNRFGQVVYDNLFMNRMAKDISHLMIRSVGWNLGTVRELGGGVWDLKDTVRTGNLSARQTYTLALLGTTALMGYTLNSIYGQKVDRPVDLLYPKTGKIGMDGSAERIYLKTYVHDAYGMMHAPGQTAVNKLAPAWHQVADLYQNADYFDRQIHPIHATNLDAITDPKTWAGLAKYEGQSALPFSITNIVQRRNQGESIGSAISSSAAILPAPRWAGESKAEALAYSLYRTHLSRGPNDADVSDRLQKYHQLATGYVAGTITTKDLLTAYRSGILTDHQYNGILEEREGQMSPLERHSKRLSANEFLRVFDTASPSEQQSLKSVFYSHWDYVNDNEPGGEDSNLYKAYFKRSKIFSGQK